MSTNPESRSIIESIRYSIAMPFVLASVVFQAIACLIAGEDLD